MPDNRGINGRALARLSNDRYGGVPFILNQVVTGAETKSMFDGGVPFKLRVLRAWGTMKTAGTASDTAVLQRVAAGTTSSITDTADLSSLADTDTFEFSQYDDDHFVINVGETLQITTANGSSTTDSIDVTVMCVRV